MSGLNSKHNNAQNSNTMFCLCFSKYARSVDRSLSSYVVEYGYRLVVPSQILMVSVYTSKRDERVIPHPSVSNNLKAESGVVSKLTKARSV